MLNDKRKDIDLDSVAYTLTAVRLISRCRCVALSAGDVTLETFCETETFNATCAVGEAILMTHARYGRMRLSRCVRQDYGHVGCGADVMAAVDRRCSGRRSCEIAIPDASFSAVDQPCPQDLKPYLEAAYRCVTGRPI